MRKAKGKAIIFIFRSLTLQLNLQGIVKVFVTSDAGFTATKLYPLDKDPIRLQVSLVEAKLNHKQTPNCRLVSQLNFPALIDPAKTED